MRFEPNEKITVYDLLVRKLKTMDEKQLLEFFHDIDDISIIERISHCAYHFVENFELKIDDVVNGKSDYADWKQQDDAQRYRDIKSEQG